MKQEDLTPEHQTQLRHVDGKVEELEDRFDRHLEIYASNGKELAGVKVELANVVSVLTQLKNAFDKLASDHEKRLQRSENTITYFTGVVIGIGSLVGIVWAVLGDFLKAKFME